MIEGHLNRARSNERFVAACEEKMPGEFYDWKTTANFYCALHIFRAFLKSRKPPVEIENHDQLVALFNPKRNNGNPPIQIKTHVWQAYCDLRRISEASRYGMLYNEELEMAIQKEEFHSSVKKLAEIKNYFSATFGLNIEEIAA